MSFNNLGLRAELVRAVIRKRLRHANPHSTQAIPLVLEGRDLMGSAQTGTGKTAGFTLPILQRLAVNPPPQNGRRPVRALVITPTRELAAQVHESIVTYGQYLSLKSTVVFGGVSINPQKQKADSRRRYPGGHARSLARPRRSEIGRSFQVEITGARRSRPHARHGFYPRHSQSARAGAETKADAAVFRNLSPTTSRNSPTACCIHRR